MLLKGLSLLICQQYFGLSLMIAKFLELAVIPVLNNYVCSTVLQVRVHRHTLTSVWQTIVFFFLFFCLGYTRHTPVKSKSY